jgi:hypothetical protein
VNRFQPSCIPSLSIPGFCFAFLLGLLTAAAEDPVRLRVETITVPPSTGPLVSVIVKNLAQAEYQGTIGLKGPENWRMAPPTREVTLAKGETAPVPFSIEQGRNVAANRYTFQVTATSPAGDVTHRQSTFVASAPYFKPTVDGQTDDWKDAIPITFTTNEKATTISTYWSRRRFSLLVAVEEDRLRPYGGIESSIPPDAIQLAISPRKSSSNATSGSTAGRFEFLVVATGDGAKCFQLASVDTDLQDVRQPRLLEPLICDDVDVVVRRDGNVTYYECSLPFSPMRDAIRPTEGREFYMSVLVYDPDGTGLRDLGAAAGLWSYPSDADAWSRWGGDMRGEEMPLGNKILWGLCTSKY